MPKRRARLIEDIESSFFLTNSTEGLLIAIERTETSTHPSIEQRTHVTKRSDEISEKKPQHVEFVERFKAFYEAIVHQPYNFDTKQFITAHRLIKKHGMETVIAKAKTLGRLCRDRSTWFTKCGWGDFTIGKLSCMWNSIILEAAKPTEAELMAAARQKLEAHNARVNDVLKRGRVGDDRRRGSETVRPSGPAFVQGEEGFIGSGNF
jgi:hypothetical protein